jgi:hypothetical protein
MLKTWFSGGASQVIAETVQIQTSMMTAAQLTLASVNSGIRFNSISPQASPGRDRACSMVFPGKTIAGPRDIQ